MKEKGADPTTENYSQRWRWIVEIIFTVINVITFVEDLSIEEACHGKLRKDEEAESTKHRPSASFLVQPELLKLFGLWSFPVIKFLLILIFVELIRCRCLVVIIAWLNDISTLVRIWAWVDERFFSACTLNILTAASSIRIELVHIIIYLVRVGA